MNNHCNGRIIVDIVNKNVINVSGIHKHAGDPVALEVKKIVNESKDTARNDTSKKTIEIATEARSACSSTAVSAALPTEEQLLQTLRRTRRTTTDILANPATIEELIIPDDYKAVEFEDNGREEFLFFDSGPDDKRFLIFATENNLRCLEKCQFWHLDCSFDEAPKHFQQFLVIHGDYKRAHFRNTSIFSDIIGYLVFRTKR